MIELGELEKLHQEFAQRNVRLIVVSNDDQDAAQRTQADFPHLVVVSDPDQSIAKAFEVIHAGMAPGGKDTNVPTTFLIDGDGLVRWFFRPDRYIVRLPVTELLAAVDSTWPR